MTGRNSIIDGNITYSQWKESLTAEQKSALDLAKKKNGNGARDKLQHVQYQKVLGRKVVPQLFDKFQDLKYNDTERWKFIKLDYSRQNELIQNPNMALPNAKDATIADEKFTQYLFDGSHPEGLAKGKIFTERLGYDINNYQDLKAAILCKAEKYPVKYKGNNGHGDRYEQKIILYGSKDTPANVVVAWFVEDENKTRMASTYIKEVNR